MLLASQLSEISGRFPAHVEELRAFLRKEKLPVPSPDALPQLSRRLENDAGFRADVGSLLRVALYQEREQVGYEDLLGILVAAAAGTEHDLKSESQEADIRELLRFVLQSRRSAFRPEAEEESVAVAPEPRETVPVDPEPVLRGRGSEAAPSMKLELKPEEPAVAVAEAPSRGSDDVVLSPFRTGTLFASQMEPADSGRKVQPVWIVGVVCLLAGVGLGFTFHRVVSAAESHVAVRAGSFSGKTKPVAATAPKQNAPGNANAVLAPKSLPGAKTVETASVADHQAGAEPAGLLQGTSTPPPATTGEKSSGVPMTVVRQVVTASPSRPSDSGGDPGATQITAATHSIVPRSSAGIMAANVIFSPAPEYPAAAAAARVHGQVTVHAVVDPEGNVIYARAVSGPPLLRDAAQQAVQRWRYRPLIDNGKPIAVTTTAIVDFKFAR